MLWRQVPGVVVLLFVLATLGWSGVAFSGTDIPTVVFYRLSLFYSSVTLCLPGFLALLQSIVIFSGYWCSLLVLACSDVDTSRCNP